MKNFIFIKIDCLVLILTGSYSRADSSQQEWSNVCRIIERKTTFCIFIKAAHIDQTTTSMLNASTDIEVVPDKLVMKARSIIGLI